MTASEKAALLHRLAYLNGGACAAIGLMHVARGSEGPGLSGAGVNEDSQEAFYGGVFAGYGAAWLWAARQQPMPVPLVRFLSATMALGGVGRIHSIRRRGRPHPFWLAMAGVELAVPALLVWLASAE